jgi:hypothetical protein
MPFHGSAPSRNSSRASAARAGLARRLCVSLCLSLTLLMLLNGSASAAEADLLASEAEPAQCEWADAGQGSCSVPVEPELELGSTHGAVPAHDAVPPRDADGAAAPMCDRTAASVVAVVEVPEVDRGRLEQLRCDDERWLALLGWHAGAQGECFIGANERAPQPRQPASGARATRHEASVSFQPIFPARATPTLLPALRPSGLMRQPGHPSPIYRPPTC